VCDFGLSRIIADDQNLTTLGKLRGTYAYTAPELYHGATFTTKSDVYSIGIVLWEMVNRLLAGKHDRPFAEYKDIQHDFQVIVKAATKKLRPTIPATCPEPIANLIKFCWHERQEDRPSCADLLVILEKLTNDYNANREAWDSVVPEVVPQPRFKREPSMKQGAPAIASPKGHAVRLSASMSSTDSHTISSPNGTSHQRGASSGGTPARSAVQSNRDSPRKSDPGESSDQNQTSTEVKS
jgi:serine/threonine protein kinase